MKFFKIILASAVIYLLLFASGTQFSACTKTNTVHDTLIKKDTIIKKDTVTIVDSMAGLKDGLVAWYTFTNGSLKDSSGNNNDIILNNNATKTTDRFGKANNAFSFDGSASYMQVKNSTSLNPVGAISIMAIVKPNNFYQGNCHGNQLVSKGYNDYINGFYTLRFANTSTACSAAPDVTKEYFYGAYGDNAPAAYAGKDSAYVKLGQWYNVIYTYDGFVARLYVNGVIKDVELSRVPFTPNSKDLFIGKHEDPAYPYYLNGVIDEVRIYNRALCDDDIRQLNGLKQ